jgi:hypothetical protein
MQLHTAPLLYAAKGKTEKKIQLQVAFRFHFGDLKYLMPKTPPIMKQDDTPRELQSSLKK